VEKSQFKEGSSQPAKGADLRSCVDGVHWDLTGSHGWLLGWCPPGLWSGRVCCV